MEAARKVLPVDEAVDAVLARWFSHYRPALFGFFVRRTHNASDAEDLVQDVFIRLVRLGPAPEIHDIEAFIFRTATNLLRDAARRRQTHPQSACGFESFEPADGEPSPQRVLEAKAELARVVGALESLGERTRRIFILRRLEQMKCQEIADLFGISVKAVEHHIARALAHLAKLRA